MTDPAFVYVTYITSMLEKIWDALVKADVTRQYWRHEKVSDWKPGSEWRHVRDDAARTVDLVGEVVESDRPRWLVLTWPIPPTRATSPSTREQSSTSSCWRADAPDRHS
jgi:uncharacterized protein YndB with AHSA1/START domain